MSEPSDRPPRPIAPLKIPSSPGTPAPTGHPSASLKVDLRASKDDKVLCERCGAEMYRMHAVWRCSACGFKTDCCGW